MDNLDNLHMVALRSLDYKPITRFPVRVINVEGVDIGFAPNQQTYCRLWNEDPVNRIHGLLEPGYPPTSLTLFSNGPVRLTKVAGVPIVFGEQTIP
jgi:hypothetical protein